MSQNWPLPCGIAAPQAFADGEVDLDLIRSFAVRAEEVGYHSLWVAEQILGTTPTPEPVSFLSYLAGVTRRIRLGSAVIIATTRNPVLLAKQLSTLDVLSDGRLIVGTALGGRPPTYPLFGGPSDARARHFAESVQVMKALWTQDEATFDGQFWQLDGIQMSPKPVQKPHPPLWFGGRHPSGLRRTARLADGWMGAGSTTTEQFKEHVVSLRRELADRGRDPAAFPISKRVYIAVDDDRDRAERRLTEWFGAWYGRAEMGAQVSAYGSVAQCVNGLNEIVEGGAGMLMLNPMFDHAEHLERLASDVIPRLSA
ncbi:MAG: LLM class flavin-dependent oxidoreductase [SAR202 cluster bacterium]|jgi:probable F420-dependent oxidoreductase|nr:LLM class F420-dependent oxidoreductase [Chloroflexota bacterium]MDP6419816.1 LLM class flavin-dependent oxidoreductase [SAR202 cluster bacterium]MDP6663728.1 LLM class flavin-dependent oxidoreductase [SAR202 cluster bacterium]MDP6800463.1 LLM class flavin-dependent oxidoreductase [SAR202 cluster bacterium]MQG56548.1 LLM class flavin-dependent oxidoreductase [SAR202 cluster bacterium]|tara:strand:- start:1697 stop:2632 length:936 start_codon:yes stop_codon:yes gene_type:complete